MHTGPPSATGLPVYSARQSANTARPSIRAGVSRNMPVYSPPPAFAEHSFQPNHRGEAQAE